MVFHLFLMDLHNNNIIAMIRNMYVILFYLAIRQAVIIEVFFGEIMIDQKLSHKYFQQ